jgi:hypothetical protein
MPLKEMSMQEMLDARLDALKDAQAPAGALPDEPRRNYVILDVRPGSRSAGVQPPLFWAPDRQGYTRDLDKAGRYTEEEAKRQAQSRSTDLAVPLKLIHQLSFRTAETLEVMGQLAQTLPVFDHVGKKVMDVPYYVVVYPDLRRHYVKTYGVDPTDNDVMLTVRALVCVMEGTGDCEVEPEDGLKRLRRYVKARS